jgi:hypothetical protein
MSAAKKKGKDEYVTLRLEVRKSVYVTTYGTVNLKVPRANRRRISPSWRKVSQFAAFLDQSNCIEWSETKPGCWSHLLIDVETLPDSDQAYRCRFNPETKEWEREEAEGEGDED